MRRRVGDIYTSPVVFVELKRAGGSYLRGVDSRFADNFIFNTGRDLELVRCSSNTEWDVITSSARGICRIQKCNL